MERMITAPDLAALPGVRHGFFTRQGGISNGIYTSLNIGTGSDDDPGFVAENRRRVAADIGGDIEKLLFPHQIHSPDVVTVREAWPSGEKPKADALVTAKPGFAIGVSTADCGPVLFADAAAGVVGAAHSGWKGAVGGVLDGAVEAMIALGAKRASIRAVLGPTISADSYEVGPEFVDRFLAEDAANRRYFGDAERSGHKYFDLPGYIVQRLTDLGVAASSLGLCTYRDEKRFYSYRRATHRGENDYGRLASVIMLEPDDE